MAPRGSLRTALVWEALQPLLDSEPLDVLDIGGGTGGSAVGFASHGHRVDVVDPSPDALAALARRAAEADVTVRARQGDLATLDADPGSADLVLCHGVLEVAGDPAAALTRLATVLRPGGRLSLLVSQRHAAVIARAMGGHFAEALGLLDDTTATGRAGRRFTVDEISALLAEAGFTIETLHGVRVFSDLIPGALLDAEVGATADLIELERAASHRAEFLSLAAQIHLIATLPSP
jgi:SAM-dependent methyltransferase